jgi:hypothetical protein
MQHSQIDQNMATTPRIRRLSFALKELSHPSIVCLILCGIDRPVCNTVKNIAKQI